MDKKDREIYCPKCAYRPRPEDRWSCLPRCDTAFHTFWTGAVCPGCGIQWPKTQCPACGELSPHAEWYHQRQYDPAVEETHQLEG